MNDFTKVPNKLLELTEKGELDCYDIAVYFAIFRHRNQVTKKCFPSTRQLSKLLKISDKTVRIRIKRLEDCGILNRTYKRGAVTQYTTAVSDDPNCGTTYLYNKTKNKTKNKEEKIDFKKRDKMINDVRKKYNIRRS